jgi:hypothetical protein
VAERARGSKQRPETLACLLARAADALSGIDSMESALRLARQAVSVIGEVEYPQDGGRFREACRLSAGVVAAHASIDEALRVARLAEKAHVEEPERLVLLGILSALSRAGRNAETVDIARKLVAIAPSQRLVLAEALIRAGSPDEAEAVGRTALTDNLSGMPVATRDRA